MLAVTLLFTCCKGTVGVIHSQDVKTQALAYVEQHLDKTLGRAQRWLGHACPTITATTCPRSTGGPQDFYSEGDYWWPDPDNPSGPYIRRDGLSNPDNFSDHRKAMQDLAVAVSSLTAAYHYTRDTAYSNKALHCLEVFFLDSLTMMNPHMLYAQAIQGRHTGRGIGLIDGIHLIEVTVAIQRLQDAGVIATSMYEELQRWFFSFSEWMTTHPYGIEERDHGNNHSTWWAAQLAAYANLTGSEAHMAISREQFEPLLSVQMRPDGGFIDELSRTKPYSYSLFHLEGYAIWCYFASAKDLDLWRQPTKNGTVRDAWDFMLPYIIDKSSWPYPADVQNYEKVPIQTVGMLLATLYYEDNDYLKT